MAFADLDQDRALASSDRLLSTSPAINDTTHLQSTQGRRQLVFQPGPALFVGPADHALGLLADLVGDRQAAVRHLRDARALAARCGQWWVERSDQALADLR